MMDDVFKKYWLRVEDERVRRARDMQAWLDNDREGIIAQVKKSMRKMFREKTVKRMSVRVFNIVPRVVRRLAQLYTDPPVRALDGGIKFSVNEAGERTPEQSDADKLFQEILVKSSIERNMKDVERAGMYFNTVLVQPRYNEPDDGADPFMDFVIHTPAYTVVEWDEFNFLKPKAFYFPAHRTINGTTERVIVYWSATEHYYIRSNNERIVVPGMTTTQNPYKVLPVAVFRVVETNDGWGEGMWDLSDGNLECCEQVTNICYTAKFQTHGQPVAVNLNMQGEPEIGPDKVISVTDKTGGATPSFSFANANPMIAEVRDLIDWMLRTLQNIRGIGGSSLTLDASIQSGVSKIQDNVELIEGRKDMVPIATAFEHDLFRVLRAVWNYHGKGKIPETAVFSVKFKEPEQIKTTDDKIREREFGLKNNTVSIIDIIMQDNPQMDEEQAAKRFDQIVAERRRINDKYGFFEPTTLTALNSNDNQNR